MAKDPAFLFYSNDFLSGTYTFTDEQVGKYIRLLCLQHQKGTLSENEMLCICGRYDAHIFSKFIKTDEGYFNARLKEESDKRKKYSESRRNNKLGKKPEQKQVQEIEEPEVVFQEDVLNDTKEFIFSLFGDMNIMKSWQEWLEYKQQQFKFKYKSKNSEHIAIKHLYILSNGKSDTANNIINQSIANGWKGFFANKQESVQQFNESRFKARTDYANRHNS